MQKLLTVKLDITLYDWIHTYAIKNDLSVSQVIRHSLRAYTQFGETPAQPSESAKPTPDDDVVGVDGYTKAQRAAILARAKQRAEASRDAFTAERPRELSPIRSFDEIELEPVDVPTKPNIVMGEAERQKILDDWA